jgi:hypothetical protein
VTSTGARLGLKVGGSVASKGKRVTLGTAVGVSVWSDRNSVLGQAVGAGGFDGAQEGPPVGVTLVSGTIPGAGEGSGRDKGAEEGVRVALGEGSTGDWVSCPFARLLLLLLGLSPMLLHVRPAVTATAAKTHTSTAAMTTPRRFMLLVGVVDLVVSSFQDAYPLPSSLSGEMFLRYYLDHTTFALSAEMFLRYYLDHS